jgi:hypothetical protein
MSEKETLVRVIRIELICDNCGKAMKSTGMCLTVQPPLFPHKCSVCGNEENTRKKYPYLKYENY